MTIYYTHSFEQNDKNESHRLLEKAISIHIGDENKAKSLIKGMYTCTKYGKPRIDYFNEFSISHSKGTWAVLIADSQCGLDIQYSQNSNIDAVARRYYSKEEYEHVSQSSPSEFFRIWARREALVKAVGTTVVNSNLPCVIFDRVEFEEELWIIKDVKIPLRTNDGLSSISEKEESSSNLFSAVCIRKDEEVNYVEI